MFKVGFGCVVEFFRMVMSVVWCLCFVLFFWRNEVMNKNNVLCGLLVLVGFSFLSLVLVYGDVIF